MRDLKGLIVSDFNAENLASLLTRGSNGDWDVTTAPFGQVFQSLDPENGLVSDLRPDFLVVWTRPEGILNSYSRSLAFKPSSVEDTLSEVDVFAETIRAASRRARVTFVMNWAPPLAHRGTGLTNLRPPDGPGYQLLRMNLRLSERLADAENVYVMDVVSHLAAIGSRGYSEKSWYLGKIPYGLDLFKRVAADIRAAFDTVTGSARKLVVLDLDNTLWGGVVGDDGWENLTLGGHSAKGEAFVDFQRELAALKRRGVILAIASKNEESIALQAINSHPEMVLRNTDFVAWRINWRDKAQNIVELAQELNLGLQSVVFIDDNPVERARVAEELPEVLVPDWPVDCTQYCSALRSLTCFDIVATSEEDQNRTQLYDQEKQRNAIRIKVSSASEWLETLGTQVRREELNTSNLPRAVQLLNKTNQMNLSTRRLTSAELVAWAAKANNAFLTFRISDKFGDAGLTGLLGMTIEGPVLRIVDFVLSCRVMGRKVEETMVATAVDFARRRGLTTVLSEYLQTEKNRPCLDFWIRSGFRQESDVLFEWDCERAYPYPDHVEVIAEEVLQ